MELLEDQAVLALSHVPDQPGVAARLFESLSAGGVNVDLIIQATHEGSSNDITFTVAETDLYTARSICTTLVDSLGGNLSSDGGMSKLSIRALGSWAALVSLLACSTRSQERASTYV